MKKRWLVVAYRLSVIKLFFILFFFMFTIHFSLVTASDEINSKAAAVMDASTGRILYAKNPNLRLPPASTTKLMTAIVVIENSDITDIVTVSKNVSRVSPLKAGFKEGDRVTIETLLYAALLRSANDATVALAEAIAGSEKRFVLLMNRKAIAIGAKDTKFINSNGLPGQGQYTTAFDLSQIMSYALRYPRLKEIIGTRVAEVSSENGNTIFLKNTNRLLWSDENLVGGKTGYTRRAKHCFVCAAEREKDSVVVTLLGSPSRDDLWREAETLVQKGFRIMANNEEPYIYIAKADYDVLNVGRASYKKSSKFKVQSSNKIDKKKIAKNKTKHKKTKMFAKKKGKKKTFTKVKNKKGKIYRIAEKGEVRNRG